MRLTIISVATHSLKAFFFTFGFRISICLIRSTRLFLWDTIILQEFLLPISSDVVYMQQRVILFWFVLRKGEGGMVVLFYFAFFHS